MQAERLARGEPIEIVRTQREMVNLDVQITAAEISATADILKETGFFDDYQLGSDSPGSDGTVPADSETSETVASEDPQPTIKQRAALALQDTREVFYGGATGGGKSDWPLMEALEYVDILGYSGILLRESYANLKPRTGRSHASTG